MTRRHFLQRIAVWLVTCTALFSARAGTVFGRRRPRWAVRPATPDDAADLAKAYEQTRRRGHFPQRSPEPMTVDRARRYLLEHRGSLCVTRNGRPVAFVGMLDWGPPGSDSAAQTTDPRGAEIDLLAAKVGQLRSQQRVRALQLATAATVRSLAARGYRTCHFCLGTHNLAVREVVEAYVPGGTRLGRRFRRSEDRVEVVEVVGDLARGIRVCARREPQWAELSRLGRNDN